MVTVKGNRGSRMHNTGVVAMQVLSLSNASWVWMVQLMKGVSL